jgi:alkanesulfonate monooxygenase SsuD/methylene tetrahydromethanopterin reductase-like flavin-dependent oxidoreductase (luciferase family)
VAKVELFNPVIYYGDLEDPSWPVPPRMYDTARGVESMEWGFVQAEVAAEAGFDSINFAEHHYSPNQLSPNPIIYAGIAGKRIPNVQIGVFGTDLPIVNPIRAAEEYAMLDTLLEGRLRLGLLRGTPNEYLTYGTNPWESRERFEEAVRLFILALTEPEPFGWEGRFYRFRNVSVWPRPYQKPHPRILMSGNSPSSAAFAGSLKADIGLSYMTADKCVTSIEAYREAAAAAGWTPTEDNITIRNFTYVAETDEQAQRETESWGWPGLASLFSAHSPEVQAVLGLAGAAMAGVPKGVVPDMSRAAAGFRPATPFLGSPETVLELMAPYLEVGIGRFELGLTARGIPPHEKVCESLRIIGERIVPTLHAAEPALAAR